MSGHYSARVWVPSHLQLCSRCSDRVLPTCPAGSCWSMGAILCDRAVWPRRPCDSPGRQRGIEFILGVRCEPQTNAAGLCSWPTYTSMLFPTGMCCSCVATEFLLPGCGACLWQLLWRLLWLVRRLCCIAYIGELYTLVWLRCTQIEWGIEIFC